jgi:hypothetical protein
MATVITVAVVVLVFFRLQEGFPGRHATSVLGLSSTDQAEHWRNLIRLGSSSFKSRPHFRFNFFVSSRRTPPIAQGAIGFIFH